MKDLANNGFNGVGKSLALITLTDMNSFTTEGIYGGIITLSESILNLPLYASSSGSQRVKIEVTCDEPTKIILTQKITYQDGLFNNRVFLRTRISSTTWKPWIELINSSRVINNFTTTEDGFVADAKALKTIYDLATRLVPASIVATLNGSDYYDYTIPSGTLTTSPQIWAVVGDSAGSTYVVYTKRVSDTVIRIGLSASGSCQEVCRKNLLVLYRIFEKYLYFQLFN